MNELKDLFDSMLRGDTTAVREALLQHPELATSADKNGKTPLHMAGEKNNAEAAKILLSLGAELERETQWGMTPLEWAANTGGLSVVDMLQRRGARMNMRSAAAVGKLDLVQSFWESARVLKPGAAQKAFRQTENGVFIADAPPTDYEKIVSDAFYIACRNGHPAVAAWLLERGAEIDYRGYFGATALHWAAGNGHQQTVHFLIDRGARTDLKDDEFDALPAEWARNFCHTEIAAMLDAAAGSPRNQSRSPEEPPSSCI